MTSPLRLFVRALDDDERRCCAGRRISSAPSCPPRRDRASAATAGVAQLRRPSADSRRAGRDRARARRPGRHADAPRRSGCRSSFKAAKSRETPIEKPVAGRVLGPEPADEPVVAPAAADRAETHRMALFVAGLEGQIRLEDGAGVIFEAAHDGRVDADAVRTEACVAREILDLQQALRRPARRVSLLPSRPKRSKTGVPSLYWPPRLKERIVSIAGSDQARRLW